MSEHGMYESSVPAVDKGPSDRDLMIRYRMALEAIVALPATGAEARALLNVAKQSMKFGVGTDG